MATATATSESRSDKNKHNDMDDKGNDGENLGDTGKVDKDMGDRGNEGKGMDDKDNDFVPMDPKEMDGTCTDDNDEDACKDGIYMDYVHLQDEADPEINDSVRLLALAMVHTDKSFSQAAFYKDMRAAWNPAQPVRFRLAEEVPIVFMPIWLQIHKIPEGFCKKNIVENLLRNSGEILEMWLNGNTHGDYIRVRVRHDVCHPLTKFVSILRGKERQVYLVRYEKLARFCSVCGLIDHDGKECGSGVHEEKENKYGTWLYADGLNKSPSNESFGPGRSQEQPAPQSQQKKSPGIAVIDPETLDTASNSSKEGHTNMQVDPAARKRLAMEDEAPVFDNTTCTRPSGVSALT
ncbi:hypothetical protein D1007_41963 [Hordeum vulgare]|nr:hypothetical protein D1007_41963 [Hordeum vulgare]